MESSLETVLTSCHKAKMILYVRSHPECFLELINLTLSDKQPYSWRASWLLWSCMDKNDPRVKKYLSNIIKSLPHRATNQQRELLKIIDLMVVDKKLEGILFNHCVDIWKNIHTQPSVRCNALRMLSKIALKHPDLIGELKLLTQDYYTQSLSKSVLQVIAKLLKSIQ